MLKWTVGGTWTPAIVPGKTIPYLLLSLLFRSQNTPTADLITARSTVGVLSSAIGTVQQNNKVSLQSFADSRCLDA